MEISILPDSISSITHSLPFSIPLLKPNKNLSLQSPDTSPPPLDQPFHVTAGSPPSTRTITRRRPRTIRRVKRKSAVQENDENSRFLDNGFFGGNDGGFFGKGGNGNSGNGWSWGGYSEGGEDSSVYDPAFDFVYGVLCWIALSNCLLFSFKRVVRLFGDRGKVTVEMTTSGY